MWVFCGIRFQLNTKYFLLRKLYMDLCGSSSLSSSVSHPTKSDERLFLLFDFTHNMKNIFNNFVSRKTMYIPETADEQNILGGRCIAKFAHIQRLYAIEEHKPLKVAHSLKKHLSIRATLHAHLLNMH